MEILQASLQEAPLPHAPFLSLIIFADIYIGIMPGKKTQAQIMPNRVRFRSFSRQENIAGAEDLDEVRKDDGEGTCTRIRYSWGNFLWQYECLSEIKARRE